MNEEEKLYNVRYQAGTYSGVKEVWANDEASAIAQVKSWVHKTMSLSMYYESYRVE